MSVAVIPKVGYQLVARTERPPWREVDIADDLIDPEPSRRVATFGCLFLQLVCPPFAYALRGYESRSRQGIWILPAQRHPGSRSSTLCSCKLFVHRHNFGSNRLPVQPLRNTSHSNCCLELRLFFRDHSSSPRLLRVVWDARPNQSLISEHCERHLFVARH